MRVNEVIVDFVEIGVEESGEVLVGLNKVLRVLDGKSWWFWGARDMEGSQAVV